MAGPDSARPPGRHFNLDRVFGFTEMGNAAHALKIKPLVSGFCST